MSIIEYFHVFESILYSLTLANILYGAGRMIKARQTISQYWVYNLLVLMFFLLVVRQFYTGFSTPTFKLIDSPLTFIVFVVLNPGLYVITSQLVIPEKIKGTDFREYFLENKGIFYVVIALFNIVQIIENTAGSYANGKFSSFGEFLIHAQTIHFAVFTIITFLFAIGAIVGYFTKGLKYSQVYFPIISFFTLMIVVFIY